MAELVMSGCDVGRAVSLHRQAAGREHCKELQEDNMTCLCPFSSLLNTIIMTIYQGCVVVPLSTSRLLGFTRQMISVG